MVAREGSRRRLLTLTRFETASDTRSEITMAFNQPRPLFVIRRDGTVLDRAAGVAIGRVFRESGGRWNHSLNGLVYYRWPTRRQAADELLRIHRRSQAPGGREGQHA